MSTVETIEPRIPRTLAEHMTDIDRRMHDFFEALPDYIDRLNQIDGVSERLLALPKETQQEIVDLLNLRMESDKEAFNAAYDQLRHTVHETVWPTLERLSALEGQLSFEVGRFAQILDDCFNTDLVARSENTTFGDYQSVLDNMAQTTKDTQ